MIMRRISLTALAVALIGVGVTACTEAPLEPQTSAFVADARPLNQDAVLDVIQSVTGSAHRVDGEVHRTVTINIFKYSDGTVEGWYHSRARRPGGAHVRVRVECLHVVGNQAWANGTIVAAVNPDNIGRPYTVRFIDNGEGEGAAPDEFGVARFGDFDCTTEPDLPLRQLEIGNVQIIG
jgi:hypothetical protein